jgi:hypothetical protein
VGAKESLPTKTKKGKMFLGFSIFGVIYEREY